MKTDLPNLKAEGLIRLVDAARQRKHYIVLRFCCSAARCYSQSDEITYISIWRKQIDFGMMGSTERK